MPGNGQAQQGFHWSGTSQGENLKFQVREKAGNFETGQGILACLSRSEKSQGILFWSHSKPSLADSL